MHYELYIDVFFLVNGMLDFLVLLIVKKGLRYPSKYSKMLVSAAFGSFVLCIFVLLPIQNKAFVQFVFYIIAYSGMSAIAFGIKKFKTFISGFISLYVVSFFISGIYNWLAERIHNLAGLCFSALVIYSFVKGIIKFFRHNTVECSNIYHVTLEINEQTIEWKAIWDTGNRLRSPYHQRGVSIVGYGDICPYLQEETRKRLKKYIDNEIDEIEEINERKENELPIMLIPYGTISNARGLLPIIEAKCLLIHKEGEILEYQGALLGINAQTVNRNGEFQMILTTDG